MGVFAVSGRNAGGWGFFERIVTEVVAPVQSGFSAVRTWIGDMVDGYVDLVHVRKENEELKKKIQSLTFALNQLREEAEANERLRRLLNFSKSRELPMLPARVVGRDSTGWFKTLLIDKGEKEGVDKNMAVVNDLGVVGRIIAVSTNYAKVLLVIDRNSAVDALIQESRYKGILEGEGDKLCSLKYISPLHKVEKGERVVTSGMSRVFPKCLPLGSIEKVEPESGTMFQKILVRPNVDFSRLEEVLVITERQPEKKDLP
jgi:rod shape-determining protein MreC